MSNLVLYRKYRPLSFGDVVSQDHVKTTLKNAVANNRSGHAYLFTGPRGVGKTTIARIFARAVNCPNVKDGEPCNNCEICTEFLNGTSLDVLEIDAASHTGVDNIRELIDHLQFAPTKAKYKVIIIDEVHMLSKGAFNALLKTLEEPPKHAVFVLATTEIHKVPATIVSRTQRFDFKKASISDLVTRLKFVCGDNNIQASEEALIAIAQAADGSFRDALSLLDQVFNFADKEISADLAEEVLGLTSFATTTEFLSLLFDGKSREALDFINRLQYAGKDLVQFHRDFLEYLRKVLIVKTGASGDFGLSEQMADQIAGLSEKVAMPDLVRIIEIFQKTGGEIKWSTIQSLPLELAAIEAIQITKVPGGETAIGQPRIESSADMPANDGAIAQPGEDRGEDLSKVVTAWPRILDKLKEYNHSLIPSLKLARPVGIAGKELIVTFPYKFHKDAVEQRKNKIVVDQVIEEVTGLRLMIKPVVEKDWKDKGPAVMPDAPAPSAPESSNLMESALKIMGGEVEN